MIADLEYREALHLGRSAAEAGRLRSMNPFKSLCSTPNGRKRYAAWNRGWVQTTYKLLMEGKLI